VRHKCWRFSRGLDCVAVPSGRILPDHAAGGGPGKVYWAEALGIWLACDVIEKSRYWNALGTRNPKQNKMVPICCEINFSLSGIERRIGGAVAEDERGRLFLVHAGRIGGGREGIGAELFWKHFDGRPSIVVDGDRETEVVAVGSFESPAVPLLQFSRT